MKFQIISFIKKIIIALPLLTLCNCVEVTNENKMHRTKSRYAKKVKPSEAMQPGFSKKSRYVLSEYDEEEDTEQNNDGYEYEELNDNNVNDTIIEDSSYRGHFKVGKPYKVSGISYVPQNYDDYEEIGTASWYGPNFHGKKTANGEIYNMGDMTAAHPTLPLPSIVRVTNLKNGKSVVVRVNDRGPFAKNRVIDVSKKAATLLEFKEHGTTEVKVELLREDTDELLRKLNLK